MTTNQLPDDETINVEAYIKALDLAVRYIETIDVPLDERGHFRHPVTGEKSTDILSAMWNLVGVLTTRDLIRRAAEDAGRDLDQPRNSGE